MSHHSREPLTTAENLRKLIENEAGPTLKYPRGRLTETDDGETQLKIAADKETGTVVMDFGAPTAWIGFTADQAVAIAQSLIEGAMELRGITK